MRRCRTAMCAAVVALAASVLRAQVPVTYAQVGGPKGGIREGEVEAHLAPLVPAKPGGVARTRSTLSFKSLASPSRESRDCGSIERRSPGLCGGVTAYGSAGGSSSVTLG